jgi:RNA polymerase sigma factor (sigma-70 family)
VWGFSYACLSDIWHSRRPQYSAAGLFLCLQRRKADAEKVISGHKRAVILLDFEKVTSFEIQEETMKITYEFVNETIEIEVSEICGIIIEDLNRMEYNVNRRETRRHITLDTRNEGKWLSDSEDDPYAQIDKACPDARKTKLECALDTLTDKQRALIDAIYSDGYSMKEYAEKLDVSPQTISRQHAAAIKKIKKFFK